MKAHLISRVKRKGKKFLPAAALFLFAVNPLHAKSPAKSGTGSGSKSASVTPVKSTKKSSKHSKAKTKKVKGQQAPTSDRISEIQSALARDGYYQGDPNGKLDDHTQESLRKFQDAQGLTPSGKLDALTLEKLGLGADTAGVGAPRPPVAPTPSPVSSNSAPQRPSS